MTALCECGHAKSQHQHGINGYLCDYAGYSCQCHGYHKAKTTLTGRPIINTPQLQNLPHYTEDSRRIIDAFKSNSPTKKKEKK